MKLVKTLLFLLVLTINIFANMEVLEDSSGCALYIEKNEENIVTRTDYYDPQNHIIFSREKKLDSSGNITSFFVGYRRNQESGFRHVAFTYDKNNNQTAIIREPGTENERSTYLYYNESDLLIQEKHPNGESVYYEYNKGKNLNRVYSSDQTIDYKFNYFEDAIEIHDMVYDSRVASVYGEDGYLGSEIFPNGLEISYEYNDDNRLASIYIPGHGYIEYEYANGSKITRVSRYSESEHLEYSHKYSYKDGVCNCEDLIQNLGKITYKHDLHSREVKIKSPYHVEEYICNASADVISKKSTQGVKQFKYDYMHQLMSDREFDAQSNPLDANINELDELLSIDDVDCKYDLNGNLIVKKTSKGEMLYVYDAFNRLTKSSIGGVETHYIYDYYGRRLSKTTVRHDSKETELYLYSRMNEIASFSENGELIELRIPGQSFHKNIVKAIAIETPQRTYAPIYNAQCHIDKLVDVSTKEIYDYSSLQPFGSNLSCLSDKKTAWIFAAKHYDPETNSVYFGSRYYDLDLNRWTTIDPQYFADGLNLYSYARNNPMCLIDPNGEFVIAIPLLIGGAVWGKAVVASVIGASIAYYGDKAAKKINKNIEQRKWEEFERRQQAIERGDLDYITKKKHKNDGYKSPKPRISGKEGAKNVPEWAKGNRPYEYESGKDFAKRLMDKKYGSENYRKQGPTEYSKIKKWGDRSWE